METTVERLERTGLLPVITIRDSDRARPVAEALLEAGLTCGEVTFRTPAAAEAIAAIARGCPELLLGAGTVIRPEQVAAAVDAGARFIITPGFDPAVVDACRDRDVPVFPGVCSPTEIQAAVLKGLDALKLFPAEAMGGLEYLDAVAAPFPGVRFIPTGGVGPENIRSYLASPRVMAVAGSWLTKSAWIEAGEYDRIRQEARRAVEIVESLAEEQVP
jgi:2-dehydro-3-deoxyphosphogluconate aldolase/(4S)-4-hydroxy-2-oxoglutarate aldolase